MAIGTLAIVKDVAGVGPLKVSRCTLVGDGAYPAGGSIGVQEAFNAACGQKRTILAIAPSGPNGDAHLEYSPKADPVVVTATASTDLLNSGDVAHGLVSTDPVRFYASGGNANQPGPSLPGGLVEGTVYYVIAGGLTTKLFKVSATVGGAAINLTSAGAGRFTVQKEDKLLVRVMSTGIESATADQSGTTYGMLVTSY